MKKAVCLILAVLMLCFVMSATTINAFAKEQPAGENENQSDPVNIEASVPDIKNGSALSEGSLTIIVGVATAVVFGFGGFFIGKAVGKKKQPVLASGAERTDEE